MIDKLDVKQDRFYELIDNEGTRRWEVALESKDANHRDG